MSELQGDGNGPGALPPQMLKPLLPICPYCGSDPVMVASVPFQMGPLQVLALFCSRPECRKLFTCQIIGAQEPHSPIVVPGHKNWQN